MTKVLAGLFVLVISALSLDIYLVNQLLKSDNFKPLKFSDDPKVLSEVKISSNEYIPEPLSLDRIFAPDHSWTATISGITTLVATGDVIPARAVNYQTSVKKDFKWPFLNTALYLKGADITLINLETPLIKNCPLTQTGMVFCGDEKNIEGLLFAGIDVANLANNHSENYGKVGLDYTKSLLTQNGILYSDDNNARPEQSRRVTIKQFNNLDFGFLGYNALLPLDNNLIASQIKDAKTKVDILVISYHWGAEYQSLPAKETINLAHFSVDNGADLVIGNHPHWIQPPEIYKGKLIMYAHGNFIFDQMWAEKTKEGVVGKYTFYGPTLIDAEFLPIYIRDYGQPSFLEGEKRQKVIDELKSLTLSLRSPAAGGTEGD